eukprot:1403841-Amphidinium_carterae.1
MAWGRRTPETLLEITNRNPKTMQKLPNHVQKSDKPSRQDASHHAFHSDDYAAYVCTTPESLWPESISKYNLD